MLLWAILFPSRDLHITRDLEIASSFCYFSRKDCLLLDSDSEYHMEVLGITPPANKTKTDESPSFKATVPDDPTAVVPTYYI